MACVAFRRCARLGEGRKAVPQHRSRPSTRPTPGFPTLSAGQCRADRGQYEKCGLGMKFVSELNDVQSRLLEVSQQTVPLYGAKRAVQS